MIPDHYLSEPKGKTEASEGQWFVQCHTALVVQQDWVLHWPGLLNGCLLDFRPVLRDRL